VTTEDFIMALFCWVDDRLGDLPKRSDARLCPSERVTIGLLAVLKGGYFRTFYRWLKRDFEALFVCLPDRTRLQRALRAHRAWCDSLLADPTFFAVIDTWYRADPPGARRPQYAAGGQEGQKQSAVDCRAETVLAGQ
jgi:hypothetical protein